MRGYIDGLVHSLPFQEGLRAHHVFPKHSLRIVYGILPTSQVEQFALNSTLESIDSALRSADSQTPFGLYKDTWITYSPNTPRSPEFKKKMALQHAYFNSEFGEILARSIDIFSDAKIPLLEWNALCVNELVSQVLTGIMYDISSKN